MAKTNRTTASINSASHADNQSATPSVRESATPITEPKFPPRRDCWMPDDTALDFLIDFQIVTWERLYKHHDQVVADVLEESVIESSDWLPQFLSSFEWWKNLADQALMSFDSGAIAVDPQFAEQRPKLRNLQNEALTAYMAALDQTMPYDSELEESAEETVTAVLEMLHRYWTFVRFVKKFAQSIWPSFSIPSRPHWRDLEAT